MTNEEEYTDDYKQARGALKLPGEPVEADKAEALVREFNAQAAQLKAAREALEKIIPLAQASWRSEVIKVARQALAKMEAGR